MKRRMLSVLAAGWFGIGIAYAQPAKPTDEDVERAIRVCSVGTKNDAQVEGGLNLLKRRILTGEGKLSLSEIPSVIGSQVQTDDAKIRLFQHSNNVLLIMCIHRRGRVRRVSDPKTPVHLKRKVMEFDY